MRERHDIVALSRRTSNSVLATLVAIEGSSYRRAGARLLIADDGGYAGAISGGCLEAELIRKARWSVRHGAVVQRFSTLFDDTADIPYGLGCGGVVDVLLEPSGTPEFAALMHAIEASLQGRAQRIQTLLPSDGTPLRRHVTELDRTSGANPEAAADESGWLEEILLPPPRIVIFGAGDDAQPLVRFAALMGWRVVVVDGRPQWARPERFPEADSVVRCAPGERFDLSPEDAVVMMTHSFEQDREWLISALPVGVRYLGLLGSRHRSAVLLSEAAAMLRLPVESVCEKVFAPVGLDLGGDGAEAIALAVVAEVQAQLQGKLGSSQRMTAEIVAEQIAKGGASRYLQTQCAL